VTRKHIATKKPSVVPAKEAWRDLYRRIASMGRVVLPDGSTRKREGK